MTHAASTPATKGDPAMNIVLTGSSTGIGRAVAIHLISRGHRVHGIARSDQAAFAAAHPEFTSSRCDVANWPELEKVVANGKWNHIDALVTCAGIQGEIGRALTADPARWSATVRSNLEGTYFPIRAFAPLLAKAPRHAKIVCFSGGGATQPRPNFSAYGAAKTAIVRLVETIAAEEHGRPIDINAIAPGGINTRLTDEVIRLGPDVVGAKEFAAAQKQKQVGGGSMEKVIELVDWLISASSDGVSGRLLSAPWDAWQALGPHIAELASSDVYTLRRITPQDRGRTWT